MSFHNGMAPGAPGIPALWTSSAKTGVGTALSKKSRVWFTVSHGILNEIYFPTIDRACIRDMGFIVTDAQTFFSEEKIGCASSVRWLADGVPAFDLANTCREGRYTIEKQIVIDPQRDTVLQQVQFTAREGSLSTYRLHILLAPHLDNQGGGNTAWTGEFEGTPILFAQRKEIVLALACSIPWLKRSVGFVGSSDGWQDLKAHKRMDWEYSPFTVAAQIAALLAAADLADMNDESSIAIYLRETADVWNDSIDRWMYATGTDWCRRFEVDGYYVRLTQTPKNIGGSRFQGNVNVKNVPTDDETIWTQSNRGDDRSKSDYFSAADALGSKGIARYPR